MSQLSHFEFMGNDEDGTVSVNPKFASGYIKDIHIEEGFSFRRYNFTPNDDLEVFTQMSNVGGVSFIVSKECRFDYMDLNAHVKNRFRSNLSYLSMFNEENSLSFFKKNQKVDMYFFVLSFEFLKPYMQGLNGQFKEKFKKCQNESFGEILNLDTRLHSLMKYKMQINSPLEQLRFNSLAYELVYNFLSEFEMDEKLSEDEIKNLLRAKEYILDNIEKHFTIEELVRVSKTHRRRLSQNFKIHFGKTPFDYIRKKKMLYAKDLLKSKNFNIFEVAQKTGYTHQSNFTAAFYQYFGILPKDV